ncbi:cobyrinate a,c-diamide synthase [Oceanospirillum linum]|uniref:Cobyrinic acid a,c-diamide synthase n=1 Tax=Oceanospirillum linum TaxID=966 RepID=A0A1T1HAN6_OCELI|nr:cobyrinate a,c-diamide synthase [Oceanospirillum linum]OOV86928.1 cobyrinic acid a,c-diamide synthase [Oceanospirillum linum]SEG18611.1 cobyrinic acid a,c-diamide synthase [Oleiphilus messinensis]SMP24013.1 cobyrinic acid a,c-diamide synthase [Oceanospirillum linum]
MPSSSSPNAVQCPALFIAAPHSGCGKTTITAAIARAYRQQGKIVRVFKTGPDYLDPQILRLASGEPVEQLDMWMAGEAYCQQMLFHAAQEADLILIEGVMGLFDGTPSSADLAERFAIPLALVMDVKGMAQTAGAMAVGLANYRPALQFAGLIANGCASERHRELIEEALPDNIPILATLAQDEQITLPERHLGLVQAEEMTTELESRINAGADLLKAQPILELPEAVNFYPTESLNTSAALSEKPLRGKTIAVAKDAAFSFIYDSNLRLLQQLGADYRFFSPLKDSELPEADALWLPGGYPELHAETLSGNTRLIAQIRHFHQSGKPILAECGGFLYCLDTLTELEENTYPMLGLIAGDGAMRGKRGCQGMQTAPLPEGDIRGHAHHKSLSENTPEPITHGRRQRHPAPGEPIYRDRGLTATYLHLFFGSNPDAVAALFSQHT